MSNQQPSHQFASAANAQPRRPIPAYASPGSSPPLERITSDRLPPLIQLPAAAATAPHEVHKRIFLRAKTDDYVREAHELIIRQQPEHGKVFIGKEKDRKPIDPPPVVQLIIGDEYDRHRRYLHSPYYFMSTSLVDDIETRPNAEREEKASALGGTLVSSLHKVKEPNGNGDSAFFVFGDLSVKLEGFFKLKFTLFEVRGKEVEYIRDITSAPFQVFSAKTWPGMGESTPLTRALSDQGIRLRLRKEPRFRLNPQGPASDDYAPRKYTPRRSRSVAENEALGRRQSMATSAQMMGTPQEQKGSDSEQQSIEQQEDEQQQQQQQYMLQQNSPPTPLAPQPMQPMASFITENRKRELSMSSHHGSPGPGSAFNEPLPKRTRPDEDPTQPAIYGHYPTPQSVDQATRNAHNYQEAFQMYPPGQLGPGPTHPSQHLARQPSYSHGPPNFMTGPRGGGVGGGGIGYDFTTDSGRDAVSMSPFRNPNSLSMGDVHFQQRPHSNLSLGYNQQQAVNVPQPMLTAPFIGGEMQQAQYQQQMLQQQRMHPMRQSLPQSLPSRMMNMTEAGGGGGGGGGFDYESLPDPTIDPLLAAQSQSHRSQQGNIMPRVPSMGGGGGGGMGGANIQGQLQQPQYYGRPMPNIQGVMGAGQQQNEMAVQGNNFFLGPGRGMDMGQPPGPQEGIGFRNQEGVGFRNEYVQSPGTQEGMGGEDEIAAHGPN